MGKEAEIILRIKERRLLAAMFQETRKAGAGERGHHVPRARTGDEGVSLRAPGRSQCPGARGQESVGTSRLAVHNVRSANPGSMTHHHGPEKASSRPLPRERVRPGHQPIARRARQEPAIQRKKKLLTAQRPRTNTHPTRPVKLLGPPRAYPQPAPTGQAPVVYVARCRHVPPGG